ncbi:MAG: serine/threonine-protein phosphatase [Gemmatimonadota bacterium]|nr:MAG: serine/threonine-protein phosphatase [Gemmatimonadota bacterium]
MTSPDPAPSVGSAERTPFPGEFDAYGLTHPGKVRESNQDHFLVSSLRKRMEIHFSSLPNAGQWAPADERLAYLAMVADGVGSGRKGEEASRTAIEAIAQYVAQSMRCYYDVDSSDEGVFLDALHEAAMRCHASVVQKAEEDPSRAGMATTLTLWLGVWPQAYFLQVGDSRCYLFRDGVLTQITRDQTMAQELVDQGVLTRADADNSRWAHVLSSAIGGSESVPVVTRIDQAWKHVGLLCSDGLTKHVSDERIRERLSSMESAKQVCQDLLQDALDGGGSDNITVVVGRLRPGGRGSA